jgi:predicted exporter
MTRRGVVAVLVWAAAIGASAYWLTRQLEVTTDLSAFLPAAATPAQSLLIGQLRDGVASRLILIGIEGGDTASLANASRALATELAGDQRFAFVTNGEPSRHQREQELVFRWRYLLSPATMPDRFTVAGLRTALDEALRLVASPLGPLVKRTLSADPTGEMLRVLPLLTGSAQGRTMHDGVAFSPDGRRALLVVQTRAAGFDLDAQAAAAQAIRDAFARGAPRELRLVLSSPGLLAVESRGRIQRDAQLASSLTLAGVILLLVATYRSAWPTLLSAVPALSGLAIGVVVVSVVFGPVHAITLGFGAMLIGEAIDYPTYLFANNAAGESLEATQSRIGGTLMLAVATTACGALAMLLSGFRGLAQLGLLILAGVIVAGLVTRYVLPALTPARALSRKRLQPPIDASRALAPLRRHAWIAATAIALAVVILFARHDTLWDDDLANLNPLHAATKALDRELREQTGAPDLRYLAVAAGPTREAALEASERTAVALERAVAQGALAGHDYAARYLPSEATQRRRRAALPDAATLQRNLEAALENLPFRDDVFAPFLADVERTRAGALLSGADLEATALALKVDSLLFQHEGRWVALMPLTGVTDAAAVREALGETTLLDLKAQADELVAGYRSQSLRSTLIGLACIIVVVYAGVRSIPATLRLLTPVLGAVLLTAGTLVAVGEKLTVFHLVSLLLVVGVGLNYALFFGRRHASAAERDLTLLSVSVAGLATLCAASALALTGTPVLKAIGVTTGLGAVFAFVVSAAWAPSPLPDDGPRPN